MVMQLKKKPVAVEGVQFTGDNHDEIKDFCGDNCFIGEAGHPIIATAEGEMCCSPGDVVVKGTAGEFYPVKPEIFAQTYETDGLDLALEKHWNKEEREAAPKSNWAVPHKQKLRIDDEKHVRLAWDMVDRTKDLSDEERASARRRILAKAHKFGIDTSTWNKLTVSKEDIDAALVEFDQEDAPAPRYFTEDEARAAFRASLIPPPSDVFTHLMFHLSEELSEVIWAIAKAKRYGLESICPDANISNRAKIVKEIAEARACWFLLNEELEGAGQPTIAFDEDAFNQALADRVATLQKEFALGRFTLPVSSAE